MKTEDEIVAAHETIATETLAALGPSWQKPKCWSCGMARASPFWFAWHHYAFPSTTVIVCRRHGQ